MVLSSVLIILCFPAVWYGLTAWTCTRVRDNPDIDPVWIWPAQISVLAVLGSVAVALAAPDDGIGLVILAVLLFPPIVFLGLLLVPFVASVLTPVGVAVLILTSISRTTRGLAPTFAALAMFFVMPFTANFYWDRQMCARAADIGLTDVQRAPFLYNLRRAGNKSGREPYAIALKDGLVWDWGYTRGNFVRYGGDIPGWADMSKFEPLDCP